MAAFAQAGESSQLSFGLGMLKVSPEIVNF
jgi:hypothetical protein